MTAMTSVPPVFIPLREVPDIPDRTAEYTICSAATRSSGVGTICGVQKLNQIWRLYPKTDDARVTLLSKGIDINGVSVRLYNQHPHIGRGPNGTESPSTKLTIRDVPISYSDDSIETALVSKGVVLRSKIAKERVRDPEGKLTDWLTGARFVWIETPRYPLARFLTMGPFRASLFHREMKELCNRCLEKGHQAKECNNEEVCHTCHQPGHKKNDCWRLQSYSSKLSKNTAHDTISNDRESLAEESDEGWMANYSEEETSESERDENRSENMNDNNSSGIAHTGSLVNKTTDQVSNQEGEEKDSEGEEDQCTMIKQIEKKNHDSETQIQKRIENEMHKTNNEVSRDENQSKPRGNVNLSKETQTKEKANEKLNCQTSVDGKKSNDINESDKNMDKVKFDQNEPKKSRRNRRSQQNQDNKITNFIQRDRERSASLKRKQSDSQLKTGLPAKKKS